MKFNFHFDLKRMKFNEATIQELLKQESPFATIFENTLAGVLNALGGVKGPKLWHIAVS